MLTKINRALLWVVILSRIKAHWNQKRLNSKELTQVMFLLAQIMVRTVEEYHLLNVLADQETRATFHLVLQTLLKLRVVELHHLNALADLAIRAMSPLVALFHKLNRPRLHLRKRCQWVTLWMLTMWILVVRDNKMNPHSSLLQESMFSLKRTCQMFHLDLQMNIQVLSQWILPEKELALASRTQVNHLQSRGLMVNQQV